MKKILFALIFTPFAALAQREVVSDTTWLVKTCTMVDTLELCTFAEYYKVEYSDGYEATRKQVIGDSATTVTYLLGKAIDISRGYATYAAHVVAKKEMMHSISNANDALVSVGLPEIYDLIQANFEGQFVGGAKVNEKGKDAVNGEVVKTDSGVLRLKFGSLNSRILILSDKMIRVFSYPAQGKVTDIYLVRPGIFTSIDRELTIKFK